MDSQVAISTLKYNRSSAFHLTLVAYVFHQLAMVLQLRSTFDWTPSKLNIGDAGTHADFFKMLCDMYPHVGQDVRVFQPFIFLLAGLSKQIPGIDSDIFDVINQPDHVPEDVFVPGNDEREVP
jgi:hypothetical protein